MDLFGCPWRNKEFTSGRNPQGASGETTKYGGIARKKCRPQPEPLPNLFSELAPEPLPKPFKICNNRSGASSKLPSGTPSTIQNPTRNPNPPCRTSEKKRKRKHRKEEEKQKKNEEDKKGRRKKERRRRSKKNGPEKTAPRKRRPEDPPRGMGGVAAPQLRKGSLTEGPVPGLQPPKTRWWVSLTNVNVQKWATLKKQEKEKKKIQGSGQLLEQNTVV